MATPMPPSASPEAADWEWCRRIYLDLTGLPPTPAEVDAYLMEGLHDEGVIACGGFVGNLLLRGTGKADQIRAGSFELTTGMTLDSALDRVSAMLGVTLDWMELRDERVPERNTLVRFIVRSAALTP